jgi:hypothetical protein
MSDEPVWIDWPGGDCPVAPDQSVQARLRSGRQIHGFAEYLQWQWANEDSDIVAYYSEQ